jgi:hypothetical protein
MAEGSRKTVEGGWIPNAGYDQVCCDQRFVFEEVVHRHSKNEEPHRAANYNN